MPTRSRDACRATRAEEPPSATALAKPPLEQKTETIEVVQGKGAWGKGPSAAEKLALRQVSSEVTPAAASPMPVLEPVATAVAPVFELAPAKGAWGKGLPSPAILASAPFSTQTNVSPTLLAAVKAPAVPDIVTSPGEKIREEEGSKMSDLDVLIEEAKSKGEESGGAAALALFKAVQQERSKLPPAKLKHGAVLLKQAKALLRSTADQDHATTRSCVKGVETDAYLICDQDDDTTRSPDVLHDVLPHNVSLPASETAENSQTVSPMQKRERVAQEQQRIQEEKLAAKKKTEEEKLAAQEAKRAKKEQKVMASDAENMAAQKKREEDKTAAKQNRGEEKRAVKEKRYEEKSEEKKKWEEEKKKMEAAEKQHQSITNQSKILVGAPAEVAEVPLTAAFESPARVGASPQPPRAQRASLSITVRVPEDNAVQAPLVADIASVAQERRRAKGEEWLVAEKNKGDMEEGNKTRKLRVDTGVLRALEPWRFSKFEPPLLDDVHGAGEGERETQVYLFWVVAMCCSCV